MKYLVLIWLVRKHTLREVESVIGGNPDIKEVKFGFEFSYLLSNTVFWLVESETLRWKGVWRASSSGLSNPCPMSQV